MNRVTSKDEPVPVVDPSYTEDMDPSLQHGFRVVYEREVPCEVRNQHGDEQMRQGSLELVRFKIVISGPDDSPAAVRMELCSEADLFFHFSHMLDESNFQKVQEQQKLMVELADYPTILVRMLNSCIKEPHIHLAIFTVQNDAEARLDFIQNMEYKFVELMFCSCLRSSDEVIQQQITYRYNTIKQKLAIAQNKLVEIHSLVKVKNPSLLLNIQKVTGTGASAVPTVGTGGGGTLQSSSSVMSGPVQRVGSTTSGTVFQKGFR